MSKYVLLSAIFAIGCDAELWPPCDQQLDSYETKQIWLDSSCTDHDKKLFKRSVDKLNQMSNSLICEDVLELVGTIDVSHDYDPGYDNVAVCYYDMPDWYEDKYDGRAGSVGSGILRIFNFRYPDEDNYIFHTMMHELVHYIGIHEHSDDPNAIMYPAVTALVEYNSSDADLFCSIYECVGW